MALDQGELTQQRAIYARGFGGGVRQPTQAKALDERQYRDLLMLAGQGLHSLRNMAGVQLAFMAGLRASEIAGLEWKRHILDAGGEVGACLTLTHDISKKGSGRIVPMHPDLRRTLISLHALCLDFKYVFHPLNGEMDKNKVTGNAVSKFFKRLFDELELNGCSSHSGRRTFITQRARQCNLVGASIKDLANLVGHRSIATTAGYIAHAENVVDLAELPLFHGAAPKKRPALRAA